MEVTKEISNRFRFVSGLSMTMVVFIHAKFINSRWSDVIDTTTVIGKISYYIQFLISENICRIAVPMFFLISGFWLAYINDGSITTYYKKLVRRVKTILIPYLLISALWLILYYLVGRASITSFVDFIDVWLIHPVPFQFWFLQNLMLATILFLPIIKAINKIPLITIDLLLVWYFLDGRSWGGISESILFFTIGAFVAQIKSFRCPSYLKVLGFVLYPLLLMIIIYNGNLYSDWILYVYKISILTGVFLVVNWIFNSDINPKIYISSGLSFFIYAFHEPFQGIIKTSLVNLGYCHQLIIMFSYIIIPIFVILSLSAVYRISSRIAPNTISFIVGNRK